MEAHPGSWARFDSLPVPEAVHQQDDVVDGTGKSVHWGENVERDAENEEDLDGIDAVVLHCRTPFCPACRPLAARRLLLGIVSGRVFPQAFPVNLVNNQNNVSPANMARLTSSHQVVYGQVHIVRNSLSAVSGPFPPDTSHCLAPT